MKPVRYFVLFFMVGLLTVLLIPLGGAHASSVWTPSGQTLTVRAYIDGRSDLILHRNTVHWHHFDFAAPGRHEGSNFPTYLNGTAWFPKWPDVPTAENRDCNCNSSTFVGTPQVPTRPQTAVLTIVKARGSVSIVQQPGANNNYTLVLEFNDNPEPGPDWYEVTLTYTDWQVISSANPSTVNNSFSAVAALSPSDVWAVGWTTERPLIEHWNGKAWQVVSNPGPAGGVLNSIYAVNSHDIWAVGAVLGQRVQQALIEHWDGTAWKVVPSPVPGNLSGVTAAAANEVWAVGSTFNTATQTNKVLIIHWEGKGWKVIPGINPGTDDNVLNGVTAITAHNIWAVGYSTSASHSGPTPKTVSNLSTQTLVEHWNGKKWTKVTSPSPATATNTLNAVAAVTSTDIWAVGQQAPQGDGPLQTLIERWNGKMWRLVNSPNAGAAGGALKGVAVINKDNVWAVGVSAAFQSSSSFRTLIEHWNGKSWKIDPSPNVGQSGSILFGVAGIPRTEKLWAVGYYNTPSVFLRTLTMFSD